MFARQESQTTHDLDAYSAATIVDHGGGSRIIAAPTGSAWAGDVPPVWWLLRWILADVLPRR
jgi:hypothetical protein